MHALRSCAELVVACAASAVEIERDAIDLGPLNGFTDQPLEESPEGKTEPDS